jgi:hypothetical protein
LESGLYPGGHDGLGGQFRRHKAVDPTGSSPGLCANAASAGVIVVDTTPPSTIVPPTRANTARETVSKIDIFLKYGIFINIL